MTLVDTPPRPDTRSGRTRASGTEQRILEAALRCVARWGMAKTTLDDVAREAGCSRATVYRSFPGGKDGLMDALLASELDRFFAALAARLDDATSLEDTLTVGISFTSSWLTGHRALQFLLAHEPEAVLPQIAFRRGNDLLAAASAFAGPYLERWLPAREAARTAEWAARIVMSYTFTPAAGVDLADESCTRRLVRTFVLPGLTTTVR